MSPHVYADDAQVGGPCLSSNVGTFSSSIFDLRLSARRCQLDESNKLQLNSSKTEVLWWITSRRQHLLLASALSVDGVMVNPVTSVRDLGIYIYADLSMRTHVQRTISWYFATLRQVRHIRRLETPTTFQTQVVIPVLSRLDYGNGLLVGLPAYLIRPDIVM